MTALLYEWLSPQGIIAIGVIYTAVQAWRAKHAIAEIKQHTNGMSVRLERLAAEAGVAQGREQMRAETEAKNGH